jgi:hypothetical protein
LQRSSAKLSKEPGKLPELLSIEADKFKSFGVKISTATKGHVLIRSSFAEESHIVTSSVGRVLMACDKFDTLHNHAQRLSTSLTLQDILAKSDSNSSFVGRQFARIVRFLSERNLLVDRKNESVEAAHRTLIELAQKGFVVSEARILNIIRSVASRGEDEPLLIDTIAVPTRNRSQSLKRAVESYAQNAAQYNRELQIVVVDDSDTLEVSTKNRHILNEIAKVYNIDITYANRSIRKKYAEVLAKYSEVPQHIIEFAILGDADCTSFHGANRNTILLDQLNNLCILADDDTICQTVGDSIPFSNVNLTDELHHEHRYYSSFENLSSSVQINCPDLIGIHSRWLGQRLSSVLAELNVSNVDGISDTYLKAITNENARIAITFLGTAGDSGMANNLSYLFEEGSSFERVTQSYKTYEMVRETRCLLKTVPEVTISKGRYCMTTNIGLDLRYDLPPFMPVQRNEDGVFGILLNHCCPHAFSGHLPIAILHDPPDLRTNHIEEAFRNLPLISSNKLLSCIIQYLYGNHYLKNVSFENVGEQLKNLGDLETTYFKLFVDEVAVQYTLARIKRAEEHLDRQKDAPDYWVSDIRQYIRVLEQGVAGESLCIPYDLNGSNNERIEVFRRIVGQYGSLLVNWRNITDAAKIMHSEGYRLAVPINEHVKYCDC